MEVQGIRGISRNPCFRNVSLWRIQRDRKVSLEVKISRETPSRDRKLIVKWIHHIEDFEEGTNSFNGRVERLW